MPKKTITGVIVAGALAASPVIPLDSYCFNHYEKSIYDTPTGELSSPYYLAPLPKATSTKLKIAHVVSKKPTADCVDTSGKKYSTDITREELGQQVKTKVIYKSLAEIAYDQ